MDSPKNNLFLFHFHNLLFGYTHGLLYTESGTKSLSGNTSMHALKSGMSILTI
jgi:hypothetical protein